MVLATTGSMVAATNAEAEEPLPPCAATSYIGGVATKTWADGDFKIVLFPTYSARGDASRFVSPREVTNEVWHTTQACIPGLYDELADTIYAQIECHVQGGWVAWRGDYFTGATWDLESWHPLADVRPGTACGSKSATTGEADGRHAGEAADWNVIFGPMPPDMINESTITIASPPESAFAQEVWVRFTGGQGLWTRTGPGWNADLVEALPEGTSVTLLCQTRGEQIYGPTTSDLWDYVQLADGRTYYVSDVYVESGSNDQVAPSC